MVHTVIWIHLAVLPCITWWADAAMELLVHMLAGAAMEADVWGTWPLAVLAEWTGGAGWANAAEGANVINARASVEAGSRILVALVDIMLAGVPVKPWLALADNKWVGDEAGASIGARICWAEVHELTVLSCPSWHALALILVSSLLLTCSSMLTGRREARISNHPLAFFPSESREAQTAVGREGLWRKDLKGTGTPILAAPRGARVYKLTHVSHVASKA